MSSARHSGIGDAVCAAPVGDWCGEGVLWHPEEKAVYWTDVNRFLIHRFTPHNGCVKTWFFEEPVTAVLMTSRYETLVVVTGSGAILWQAAGDVRGEPFFRVPNWPSVRANDAGVDPHGSLWIGTMRNNVNPDGSPGEAGGSDGGLFRIRPDGTVTEHLRNVGIANTVVWSPDHTKFYFADSLADKIEVFEFDGGISTPRPFFNNFGRGLPDGSTVDSGGYLWNCRYGGSCILRIAPDRSIDRVIEMPTMNITNCTFGGDDLKTLYVTTAAVGAPPAERLAGSLFAIETEFAGQPEASFKIV